jgi:hypothetical protein
VLCCAVLCCAVLCCAVLCCAVLRCPSLCTVCSTVLYCTVLYCTLLLGAEDRGENQKRRGIVCRCRLTLGGWYFVPDQKIADNGLISSCFMLDSVKAILFPQSIHKNHAIPPSNHTHCQNSVQPQLHSFTPCLPIPIPPLLPLLGPKSCT